jgi:hypothetical protein
VSLSSHQATVGKSQTWITPKWILEPLGAFDLDPCAAPDPRPWPTATTHYDHSKGHDGLAMKWEGRVWLNPPFNRYTAPHWLRKMAEHGNGIALIAARTETKAFFESVWNKASSILFLDRRPHFHYADGRRAKANSGAPIVLIGYGQHNDNILEQSGLGKWLKLATPDQPKGENR